MIFNVVVLPLPLGPNKTNTSPGATENDKLLTTGVEWYDFVMLRTSIIRVQGKTKQIELN
ncbi:hypothetical protein GCM10009122_18110 [Fulvivirga kasyanovii]